MTSSLEIVSCITFGTYVFMCLSFDHSMLIIFWEFGWHALFCFDCFTMYIHIRPMHDHVIEATRVHFHRKVKKMRWLNEDIVNIG